jgi:hypothetical protein
MRSRGGSRIVCWKSLYGGGIEGAASRVRVVTSADSGVCIEKFTSDGIKDAVSWPLS